MFVVRVSGRVVSAERREERGGLGRIVKIRTERADPGASRRVRVRARNRACTNVPVRKDLRRLREAAGVEPGRSRDERVAWGGQSGRSLAASKRPGGEDESKTRRRARAYLNASNALMSAGEDMSAGTPLLRGAIAPAGRRVAPNRAPSLCRASGFGLDSLNGRQHGSSNATPRSRFRPELQWPVAENDRERPRRFRTASSLRSVYSESGATQTRKSAHASRALRASALIASRALARWRTSRRAGRRPRFCRGRCAGAGCGRRGPRREVGRRERRRE